MALRFAGAVLDRADTILRELEQTGDLLRHERPTPSPTQAAFNGLSYSLRGYREMIALGYLDGLREQFFYEAGSRKATAGSREATEPST